jgi:hypothetical protein
MRRTKPALSPTVDVMEPKLLLSAAASLDSARALDRVVHEVRGVVNLLARTADTAQASAQLTGLASEISPSSSGLSTSWQNDLALYRPGSQRSAIAIQKRIIIDLHHFLQGGINGGSQSPSGTGSTSSGSPSQGATGTPSPSPGSSDTSGRASTPSLDSVRIQNDTGLALAVTIYLDDGQNPQPYITATIQAQGDPTVLFNFGTSTNAFMTMNISRADGLPSPAPFENVDLSQPLNGYEGTLFTISLLGPYFNVNFS